MRIEPTSEAPPADAWRDPEVVGWRRLLGRAVLAGGSTLEPADDDDVRLDLGGRWRFDFHAGMRGLDLLALGRAGAQSPQRLTVPGLWHLQGYGVPYYLANTYPPGLGRRRRAIPDIDVDRNEIGVLTREFDLPPDWLRRRTLVVFEGVKAGLYLFCNGHAVGYTQGSMLPAEFDLTGAVRAGGNTLTAVVLRFTDGSYLENQDMWHLSGIHRPVWLHSQPHAAIHDLVVTPELPEPYDHGAVHVQAECTGTAPGDELELLLRAPGAEWASVARIPVTGAAVDHRIDVPDALAWTAETPHLYGVAARLWRDGHPVHVKRTRTGIRSVTIRDEQILVNGRPIVFHGVNRHDLATAKRLNINAIRTSHYPNPQALYDAADELGLYVLDECDLETHGVRRKNVPGNNPRWTRAVVDRMRRMVLANRNHPSIVMWSLGNEAGLGGDGGGNFTAMRRAAEALDATRPFHYEGDHNPVISDVVSRMYPTVTQLDRLARDRELPASPWRRVTDRFLTDDKPLTPELVARRPIVVCEFAHAMENSLGNFAEYVDLFHRHRNLAGGFIWDYVDQAIHRVDADDRDLWLYGGDFGDRPSHRYFCANGILAADRSEHPAAREVFWAYRPLVVTAVDAARGRFRLHNRLSFTGTAAFTATVDVLVDGLVRHREAVPVPAVTPGGQADWDVPAVRAAAAPGTGEAADVPPAPGAAGGDAPGSGEVIVRFTFRTVADTPGRPADSVVAFDEFLLPGAPATPRRSTRRPAAAPAVVQDAEAITVTAGEHEWRFDRHDAALTGWHAGGRALLAGPLRRTYWRALTDNDRGWANFDPRLGFLVDTDWRDPAVAVTRSGAVSVGDTIRVVFLLRSTLFRDAVVSYDCGADGALVTRHALVPRKPMLRLGFTLRLPSAASVRWYGKGPHETYVDRSRGGLTQVHDLPLDEVRHDYLRPQENGNRTEVRWLRVTGDWGWLRAEDVTGERLGFTAWPYTQEALDAAEHRHELQAGDEVTLTVDRRQRGVGGSLPGLASLLPQYTIPADEPIDVTVRWTTGPPG